MSEKDVTEVVTEETAPEPPQEPVQPANGHYGLFAETGVYERKSDPKEP